LFGLTLSVILNWDISVRDISVRALMFSNLNTHAEHYRSDTQSLWHPKSK